MQTYKPSLPNDSDQSLDELNDLKQDWNGYQFPNGQDSANRRILGELIAFFSPLQQDHSTYSNGVLFISQDPLLAQKQIDSMENELLEINKREQAELMPVLHKEGCEHSRVSNASLLSNPTKRHLKNYIEEIKKVHDF
jgi:hypothetical protein